MPVPSDQRQGAQHVQQPLPGRGLSLGHVPRATGLGEVPPQLSPPPPPGPVPSGMQVPTAPGHKKLSKNLRQQVGLRAGMSAAGPSQPLSGQPTVTAAAATRALPAAATRHKLKSQLEHEDTRLEGGQEVHLWARGSPPPRWALDDLHRPTPQRPPRPSETRKDETRAA